MMDPESCAALVDCLQDEDFDLGLLMLDAELTCYAPPGYSLLDEDELFARLSTFGTVRGVKLA